MKATAPPADSLRLWRGVRWIVLLESEFRDVEGWRWWAKPSRNGVLLMQVLGFDGWCANPTDAVFQARDVLEGNGVADYQIHYVPALTCVARAGKPRDWLASHMNWLAAA